MSESAPYVCRWSDAHSEPLYFNTRTDLENHVYYAHLKLTDLATFIQGKRIYQCPWKDCKEQRSSSSQLEGHLLDHTTQKTFKCPICNNSRRFLSSNELHHHLIFRHNDSVMDYTGASDLTKCEQVDTSEDEDYKKFFNKLDEQRNYGKSDDDIMCETLCLLKEL